MIGALSGLVFLPLLGGLFIALLPRGNRLLIRVAAAFFSGATMIISFWLWAHYSGATSDFQFVEKADWIPAFRIHYFLGVDGISLPLVVLTTILTTLAVIASFNIEERLKEYFFFFLLLETAVLGVFLSLDLFLFYVFWELTLPSVYFLIGMWGGARKEYAAVKFFIYTLLGSLFMLVGILTLYFMSNPHTFDFQELLSQNATFARSIQLWAFVALYLGFAVKMPVVPFHTWLPVFYAEAPVPVLVMSGLLLKMGLYGLMRFSLPLLPEATQYFAFALAVLAVANILYGALCALAQTDLRRMIAYSSISHMGYGLLGLASLNAVGFDGVILQMISHSLIAGLLFLLIGVLEDRAHTRGLNDFGGLAAQMPVYAGLMTFACFASLGLPLLSGFVAEFLCLLGAFFVPHNRVATLVALAGALITACYLLLMIRKVFLGPLNPKWARLPDINLRELAATTPLVLLTLAIGIAPFLILNPVNATLMHLVDVVLGQP